MAIQQGIWKIGLQPQKLTSAGMKDEGLLEDIVMKDMSILNPDWLLIGRQVRTAYNKSIDLLAIDANGSIIIVELKRDKTPRDVVAQSIDYASWVADLSDSDIVEIYASFADRYDMEHISLDAAFKDKFGFVLSDAPINESHQMVVVATELDASTERIINYLNHYAQISINALFFAAFEDGDNVYLSRAWMIDPVESQERAATRNPKGPWNGEFYVSFGDDRPWKDARELGFIVGGGGTWYSKTLAMLSPGDRIWVNIPKTGYVGVGKVTGERVEAKQHIFDTPGGPKSLEQIALKERYKQIEVESDQENAEYLVPVEWEHTVSRMDAFSETGLFGNQNTVCKPTATKWNHTVDRLKQVWRIE